MDELQAFMGFMILMGLAHLPSLSYYWSKDPILHYEAIASRITRTRFLEINMYRGAQKNSDTPRIINSAKKATKLLAFS